MGLGTPTPFTLGTCSDISSGQPRNPHGSNEITEHLFEQEATRGVSAKLALGLGKVEVGPHRAPHPLGPDPGVQRLQNGAVVEFHQHHITRPRVGVGRSDVLAQPAPQFLLAQGQATAA